MKEKTLTLETPIRRPLPGNLPVANFNAALPQARRLNITKWL
jgi:hypothetical protein